MIDKDIVATPIKRGRVFIYSPLLIAIAIIFILFGVNFGSHFAIGSNYWDISIYLDAAHRIANGQRPNIDFQTPAGPLEYYLFYWFTVLFPDAHPLLSTHWSILIVAIPLFLLVMFNVNRNCSTRALVLTVPFVIFALVPVNSEQIYPAPSFDGYGIYNRHSGLLLYILVAAILFIESRIVLVSIVGILLILLFFSKITGFFSGLGIVAFAFLAGKLRTRDLFVCGLSFVVAISIVEAITSLVSAYLQNIAQLAAINEHSFSQRIRAFIGGHIELIILVIIIFATLMYSSPRVVSSNSYYNSSICISIRFWCSRDFSWIIAIFGAGLIFEIQNTGSHEFIYLLPALYLPFIRLFKLKDDYSALSLTLLVLLVAHLITPILFRSIRTTISQVSYQRLDQPELGPLGRVNARPIFFLRAAALNRHYIDSRRSYRQLAAQGIAHSDMLTAEPDFQLGWLINAAAAVRAIQDFEFVTGRRIDTIYTLDFTDPMPLLLRKRPITHVQIGLDPLRTLPKNDRRMISSVASAEALLVPLCPVTPAREQILANFADATEGRQRIPLTPCWDLLIRHPTDFAKIH